MADEVGDAGQILAGVALAGISADKMVAGCFVFVHVMDEDGATSWEMGSSPGMSTTELIGSMTVVLDRLRAVAATDWTDDE